ncbi:RNase H domain-containing protein [Trichonephila clavipes]|nr:RNase H domain-containing protein [Trichonephila clavipes]
MRCHLTSTSRICTPPPSFGTTSSAIRPSSSFFFTFQYPSVFFFLLHSISSQPPSPSFRFSISYLHGLHGRSVILAIETLRKVLLPKIALFMAWRDYLNNEFKIATKNCTNKCLDGSLRVSELPHPSERFPLNLVNYRKNIENNFPVVCFTDGSKINSKVGLAFVIFQDFIEIGTRQFRIRDECSVFQAELLCIAQAVSWICNNEILSSNFLICSDSLSSLCALNNIYSQNKLIVKTHINLDFLRSRGVQVFFSFVRGHTGIYGNERADWLAKEATKLRDLVPMSIPKIIS